MDIDRFRIDCEGYAMPCDAGDYCEYEDVKELQARNAELEAEVTKQDMDLADDNAMLRDRIAELEAELERERCSNLTALADADKLYEERWKVVEMLAGELASMKNQYHAEETTGSRETQIAEAWAETQVKEGKK